MKIVRIDHLKVGEIRGSNILLHGRPQTPDLEAQLSCQETETLHFSNACSEHSCSEYGHDQRMDYSRSGSEDGTDFPFSSSLHCRSPILSELRKKGKNRR